MRLIVFLVVTIASCTQSQRQSTIATTLATADAAAKAFTTYDLQHEKDLVAQASTRAQADADLTIYRSKRDPAAQAISALYRAIAVAEQLNDDSSFAGMLQAALIVGQELSALGVKP